MVSQLEKNTPLSSDKIFKIREDGKIELPKKECFPKLNKNMGHKVADLRDKGNNKRLCKKIISFYQDLDYALGLAKNLNKGTLIELKKFKINRRALKNAYILLKDKYLVLKIDINILIQKNNYDWNKVLEDFETIIPDLIYVAESAGVLLKKQDNIKEIARYQL